MFVWGGGVNVWGECVGGGRVYLWRVCDLNSVLQLFGDAHMLLDLVGSEVILQYYFV